MLLPMISTSPCHSKKLSTPSTQLPPPFAIQDLSLNAEATVAISSHCSGHASLTISRYLRRSSALSFTISSSALTAIGRYIEPSARSYTTPMIWRLASRKLSQARCESINFLRSVCGSCFRNNWASRLESELGFPQ